MLGLGGQTELRGCREAVGGNFLQEHIGHQPHIVGFRSVGQLPREQAEMAVGGRHAVVLVVVGLPLPLQSKARLIELIALHGIGHRHGGGRLRLAIGEHGLALLSHHGPTTGPVDGLQVDNAAVGALVLEMQEPILAQSSMDPAALMGAIDRSLALTQHGLALVGPVGTLRAHGKLPAGFDATCRTHNPVPAVALVELRTFSRIVAVASVEDDDRLANRAGTIGRKLTHGEHGVETSTRVGPSVDEVAATVVVPERTGVDHALARNHADGFLPRSGGILRLHHHHAAVGIAPVDVELAVVMANAGCPDTVAMLRQLAWELTLQGVADDGPVDEVAGVQHGQARHTLEGGSRQVVVVAHANDVGVAVVGIQHGVLIGAVAIVGTPHLRAVLRRRLRCCHQQEKKAFNSHCPF